MGIATQEIATARHHDSNGGRATNRRATSRKAWGASIAVAALAFSLAGGSEAQAQSTAQPDPASAGPAGAPVLEQPGASTAGAGTDDIVVTAQRREERLKDVPIAITAQSAKSLAEAGVTDTRDLARVVPGLTFSLQGPFAQPAIRGISSQGSTPGNDPNVSIYLDGVYQVLQPNNIFELPDVSRIEVLKGPQGTLFGRNATGGAIRIFTRDPSFTASGDVTATAAVYDGGGFEGGIKGFLSSPIVPDVLAASVAFNYQNNAGYLHDDIHGGRLGFKTGLIRGKLLFQPSSAARFVLTAYYTERNDDVGQAGIAMDGSTQARLIDPNVIVSTRPFHISQDFKSRADTRNLGVQLNGDVDVGIGKVTSLTSFTRSRFYQHADTDFSPIVYAHYDSVAKDKTIAQELTFASNKFGNISILAGGNYFHDDYALDPLTVVGVIDLYGRVKTNALGLFGEVDWDLTDRFKLIGGLRYSHEKKVYDGGFPPAAPFRVGEKSWSRVTPRASAMYRVSDATNVYATFSQGFKSGVFDSLSYSPETADPEKLTSYEVGIKTSSGPIQLNAAAYYYDYKDLQVQLFTGFTIVTQNAANASIYGLDLDASYKIDSDFKMSGGLAWIPHAKYDDYKNALISIPNGGEQGT
jgi:iron complex outermembrane receptor protein